MKKPVPPSNRNSTILWFRKAFNLDLPNLGTACTLLMISSINDRKAIGYFLGIASKLPGIRFKLVLHEPANEDAIRNHIGILPANCHVYGVQEDLFPFYREAHLLLDLSTPGHNSSTANLNILESMACGRPVIMPGRQDEYNLVTDGREGYLIDPADENRLLTAIRGLCSDAKTYYRFAVAARETALHFPWKQLHHH